ncbi:MAG TPA: hypothetical protein VE975_04145 [Actinomycetota bacterium]|nr:hypothetical protein [Actinomycetota bacterium]
MTYLAIMLVVAAAGVALLLWRSRQDRSPLASVEGFKEGLRKLSEGPAAGSTPSRPEGDSKDPAARRDGGKVAR